MTGGDGIAAAATGGLTSIVTICNHRGLHARAAARLVKLVDQFDAEVTVRKGDMSASGRSIMGLMMLAAGPGCEIELLASGRDAVAALAAVVDLIARRFDED